MIRVSFLLLIAFSVPSWADEEIDMSEELQESLEAQHKSDTETATDEDKGEKKESIEQPKTEAKSAEKPQLEKTSSAKAAMSAGTIYDKATDEEKKSYEEYKNTALELLRDLSTSLDKTKPDDLDLSQFEDRFKKLAELYVGMHYTQRQPGRQQMKFTGLLGPVYEDLRRMEQDTQRNIEKGIPETNRAGGGPLERAWEAALTRALDEKAKNVTPVDFAQGLLSIQKDWQTSNGAWVAINTDESGWKFAGDSLRSVGLLSNISLLQKSGQKVPDEMIKQAKQDLARFVEGKYFAKRNEESKPEIARELATDSNQVIKWGKIYSIDTLNLLEKDPSLRALMPEKFRDDKVIADYKRAFQNSLAKDLGQAFPNSKARTDFKGSSDNHSAMVFAALAALPKDLRDPIAKNYLDLVEKPKTDSVLDQYGNFVPVAGEGAGGKTHLLQYAPWGILPSNLSERASAGRYVPYALVKYQTEPTEANREILTKSLENFHLYSGSLRSEVPRGGVHAGADGLAPYYYHPALDAAGKAMTVLADTLPSNATSAEKARLSALRGNIERSALSTYDPKTKIHLSPGEETYQGVGPVWTAAHSSAALLATQNTRAAFEEPKNDARLAENKADSSRSKKQEKHNSDAWDLAAWANGMRKAASQWMSDVSKHGEDNSAPDDVVKNEVKAPSAAEQMADALSGDFTQDKAQAIEKLLESDPSLLGAVEKQLKLGENDARAVYLKSLGLRKGIETPEQLKIAQQIRDSKGTSGLEKAARDLASREVTAALARHEDWVSLLTKTNRFQATAESSLEHVLKVQQGLASEDPATRAGAFERVAQRVFSMNSTARDEMKARVAELADGKTSDFSQVMNYAYGGQASLNDEHKAPMDQALEAARARAAQWNASLQQVVAADGSINLEAQVTLVDAKGGTKQVTGKDWLEAQKATFGEDKLLKWSAQVGGETGKRTMAGVLGGGREIAFNDGTGWAKFELTQGKEGQQFEAVLSSLTRPDRTVDLKTDVQSVKARFAWDENAEKLLRVEENTPGESKGFMAEAIRGLAESLKQQADQKDAQAEQLRVTAQLAELGAQKLDSWLNRKVEQWREAKRGPASEKIQGDNGKKQSDDAAPPLPEPSAQRKPASLKEGIGKSMSAEDAEKFAAEHLSEENGWKGECNGDGCVFEYTGSDPKLVGQKIKKSATDKGYSFEKLNDSGLSSRGFRGGGFGGFDDVLKDAPKKHEQKPPEEKKAPEKVPDKTPSGNDAVEQARKRLINADKVILSGGDCPPCRAELATMGFQFAGTTVANNESLRANGWTIENVPGAGTIYRKAPAGGQSIEVRLKPSYGRSAGDDRFDTDKALMAIGYEPVWHGRSRVGFQRPGSNRIEGGGYPLLLHEK